MRSNREILSSVYKANGLTLLADEIERVESLDVGRLDSVIVRTTLQAMQLARDEEIDRATMQIEGLKKNNESLKENNRLFADENHELKRRMGGH